MAHEALRARVNDLLLAWVTGRPQREALAEQVTRDLEAEVERDRRQPQAWIWLGRSRRLLGRNAASCWEEALRADPSCREALLERSRHRLLLYARLRGSEFGRFGPLREETAEEAALRKASETDRQAARADGPALALAEFLAGCEALRRTEAAEADAALSRYLKLAAWDGQAWALRAQARRAQQKYAEAEADGTRGVELSPQDPWVAFLRGEVFHDQSRFTAAERDYTRSLELDGALAGGRWGLALVGGLGRHARDLPHHGRGARVPFTT